MTRRIWLCADDYGMAPGVNAAIRDLIAKRRLNATSVMVVAESLDRNAVDTLVALNVPDNRVAIGLHFTLTAPFAPLSPHYRPLRGNQFFTIGQTLVRGFTRRLDGPSLAHEANAQMMRFIDLFGRPPDFIDGHQHVHLLPGVADAVFGACRRHAAQAWIRQCGVAPGKLSASDLKGALIDRLSRRFRAEAQKQGIAVNPFFAGTYTYDDRTDFASLFPKFLDGLTDGSVVMCHPGTVDAELRRLDTLTDLREREYAYLDSDVFLKALALADVALH